MKRFFAVILVILLVIGIRVPAYACDENQSQSRVSEMLFGDEVALYESKDSTKMLLSALYLCCEQADNQGQDKIDYLKKQKVSKVPTIVKINIQSNALFDCSHISWDAEYSLDKKVRTNRKKILQNTVNKVFGFGKLFGGNKNKGNSLAALIYYSHILSDYLADDPENTEINYKGRTISSYCGQAYITINGGRPQFSNDEKNDTETHTKAKELDYINRCVGIFATVGREYSGPPRDNLPNPTGWNQNKYEEIVNTGEVYNRCHLIARRFCGIDNLHNLITGTRYLNETMGQFEEQVARYVESTGNHVAYRVTPIYEGENLIASGVQMEAFSVEDKGEGVCFNVYCYNVQPGIKINYASGRNELADMIYDSSSAIPFAIGIPNDSNPDLIYEMSKHLEVLFGNGTGADAVVYSAMMDEIDVIANDARSVGKLGDKPAQIYSSMKNCEYRLFQTLRTYLPQLLKNQDYFKGAFSK